MKETEQIKRKLVNELSLLKNASTKDEWMAFTLVYYEDLSVKETALAMDKPEQTVTALLNGILFKARLIMQTSYTLLS